MHVAFDFPRREPGPGNSPVHSVPPPKQLPCDGVPISADVFFAGGIRPGASRAGPADGRRERYLKEKSPIRFSLKENVEVVTA